jgi:hypothetical protein
MKAKLALIALSTLVSFTSCEEDETAAQPPVTEEPALNPIVFDNYAGSLIAVKSESNTFGGTITIGTAVGAYVDVDGNLVNVGEITCEGKKLKKAANNAYVFTPVFTSPTGIEFDGPVNWSIEGNQTTPGTNFENSEGFPTIDAINSGGTVDKSEGYTLSTTAVSNADSVIFTIGNKYHITDGLTTSYTFSSAELSSLQNGTSVASIAPYNFRVSYTTDLGDVYSVNESVVQTNVTIQD